MLVENAGEDAVRACDFSKMRGCKSMRWVNAQKEIHCCARSLAKSQRRCENADKEIHRCALSLAKRCCENAGEIVG